MFHKKYLTVCGYAFMNTLLACQDVRSPAARGISHDRAASRTISQEKTPRDPGENQANTKTPSVSSTPTASRILNEDHEAPPAVYATSVQLIANCDASPIRAAVAKGHDAPALCEHIVAIAVQDLDGDSFEIAVPFTWSNSNTFATSLTCQNGPHDNYCWPTGKADFFDAGSVSEPTTLITACAQNTCPAPRPIDCMDFLCQSVEIMSVVNIEGAWAFTGYPFDLSVPVLLTQDGRTVFCDELGIEKGMIADSSISFILGDYAYYGMITSNRAHLIGTIRDQITDDIIGEWSADRIEP